VKSTRGWSRDNRRIVYAAGPQDKADIHVVDVTSGATTQLTASQGDHSDPAWSPDDSHIAFSSTRDGGSHIYLTSVQGRQVRQLTSGPSSDVSPRWSPDGHAIVFGAERDGTRDLYLVQAKGGSLERLTIGARVTRDPPLWSPDGSMIVFQIADGENYQVGVVGVSDRTRSLLASSSAYDGSYAWAPDGKRVAFISGRDGFDGLFTVAADGQHLVRLTATPSLTPAWASQR
jgi:TolB protein